MIIVRVTAALLVHNDRIFIAKRGPSGRFAHRWEFPGGKIEPGESPEECLAREMAEEFTVQVEVGAFFTESLHTFEGGAILVLAYFCRWLGGTICLSEHEEYRWVLAAELGQYDFAPADQPIAAKLTKEFPAASGDKKE
jgi:8-oxo-dGTP diphosphatase